MSSSENEEEFYFNTNSEILGYQWESEYSETELLEMNQEQLRDEVNDQRSDELTLEFCTCQSCVILPTQDECKCCKDFQHFVDQYIGDDCICITLHQDFETVCLNRTVLETTYKCFLRYKRFTGRAPETLNPRQYRLMAYRQFLCWVRRGQPLGKKKRVVLPSCIVSKIRKTFPDPDGIYEGFHDVDSSSCSDSD